MIMMYTATRYASVVALRVGDLQRDAAGYTLVIRRSKTRALRATQRFVIPANADTAVLASWATTPTSPGEWSSRKNMLALPARWPGQAIGVGARQIRRAVINHLIAQDLDPAAIAHWTGHALTTQATTYRVKPTATERRMAAGVASPRVTGHRTAAGSTGSTAPRG